jgi:AcrR family transcriptional regulator
VGRTSDRGQQRDAELLTTATSLFNSKGYEGTSVEDIASALGILKGSLYYYISSKEDLLFRIVSEVHDEVQGILEESMGMVDLTPLERVSVYVRSQAVYNVRNTTRIAVYYREIGRLNDERRDEIRSQRRNHHKVVSDLLAEAQADGEIGPDVDVNLASHCMFATVNWIYTWWRADRKLTEEKVAESCVAFVLSGIPGPDARPGAASAEVRFLPDLEPRSRA